MGKIKTRFIGDVEVEEKQKKEQKEKAKEKKLKEKNVEVGRDQPNKQKSVEVGRDQPAKKTKVERDQPKTSRGANYQKAKKMVEAKKTYTLDEAVKLLKKMKFSKFDESVELHFNVDKTGLKGEIELPHSTGKTTKVAIVDDKILADIEAGKINFDILITHPSYMPKLARFAKVLGPKGLMPNPKAGTISPNPEEVAKKFQKGMLRWKTEAKFPLIHQMIGKLSHEDKALVENAQAFIASVGPAHISLAVIKSTMSPGVKVDLGKI